MLGLIVAYVGGLLVDVTGIAWFDGAASIIIGLILAFTAAWLARESMSLLVGESAEPAVVNGIREIVAAESGVERVHEVLTLHMGPHFILANVASDFDDGIPSQYMEASIGRMTRDIHSRFPEVRRVFVEAERRRPGDGK